MTGRVIIVTGASGGIGAATARLASARGFRVVLGYSAHKESAATVRSDIEKSGGEAIALPLDVASAESVHAFFSETVKRLGRPAALVNAAGVTGGPAGILEMQPGALRRVAEVNFLGTLYCIREAATLMARSRGGEGGAIVSISSEAARFGGNRLAAYAGAKAGINTMTVGLARELAGEGIRVNAVSPGVIDTQQHADVTTERLQGLLAGIPMGRMGTPKEVAESVLWLLSDSASYVTGAVLSVNGGR